MRLVGDYEDTSDGSDETEARDSIPLPNIRFSRVQGTEDWPAEVDLILSAMDAAYPRSGRERRAHSRSRYRTRAMLRLFAHDPLSPPVVLYTRDLQERGIGFITREPLPLGYGGVVELTLENGQTLKAHCTVYRCRPAIHDWFEGALHFSTSQTLT